MSLSHIKTKLGVQGPVSQRVTINRTIDISRNATLVMYVLSIFAVDHTCSSLGNRAHLSCNTNSSVLNSKHRILKITHAYAVYFVCDSSSLQCNANFNNLFHNHIIFFWYFHIHFVLNIYSKAFFRHSSEQPVLRNCRVWIYM